MQRSIAKQGLIVIAIIVSAVAGLTVFGTGKATALSGSEFQAGRIIDDGVFFNPRTLNAQDIQHFLNVKMPSCDTNGEKIYSGTTTRGEYGTSKGYPPPYICLKNYSMDTPSRAAELYLCNAYTGGTKSAAQIIHDVSIACDVNPQVLLVLLQKEQSLVTDDWPWPIQYRSATGFGCPDTAPCDSEYYGFFNQVYHAARIYKKYARDAHLYNYRAGRDNTILYNPNSSCGSSTVYIQNQATAGLYIYTPYRPNQAALDNLYGSGDGCSAYGNRNFWRMFNDWFGSTHTSTPYAWSITSQQMYANPERTRAYTGPSINLAPGEKAYIRITARNMGFQIWEKSKIYLGTTRERDRSSIFADASWLSSARIQMLEDNVVPGQTATFDISFTAPSKTGLYNEYFSMLAESITWMNDPGMYYSIHVVNKQLPSNSEGTNLPSGEAILPGQYLLSPDTQSRLSIGPEGDVSLFNNYIRAWTNGVKNRAIKGLYMQTDGNLVAYDTSGAPLWDSRTSNNPGAHLQLQTDGNLVIYSLSGVPLWSSGSTDTPDNLSRVNISLTNAELYPGQFLLTPDEKHRLVLQRDGNLVVYSQGKAVWHANSYDKDTSHLSMQSDGNLVLYAKNGKAIWSSATPGNPSSQLVMQPDGNLVVYTTTRPTWNSNTAGH